MRYFLEIIKRKKWGKILLLIILFISCEQKLYVVRIEYYPTGELFSETPYLIKDSLKDGLYKEYYKNGILKQAILFSKNKPTDSAVRYFETGELEFKEIREKDTIHTIHFYKNGKIAIKSKFLNFNKPIKVGWASIFSQDGNLTDSMEYINVKGSSFLNQRLHFDKNQNLIGDSSYYYNFKISKIKKSDSYRLAISYIPLMKEAQVAMILGKDINSDFSNLKNIELDTLRVENGSISTDNLKKPFRELKGFFYENLVTVKDTVNGDSLRMTIKEKRTYFNEFIKVSDTIQPE